MRSLFVCLLTVFLTACLWAQAAPPAPPQGQTAPQSGASTHHPPHGMMGMHWQHTQEMKAQVDKMQATLDQMKANLAKVKDPALKQQAQLDVDLWQDMVGHMQGMVAMMSDHDEMGMHEGMMHEEMDCCAGMKGEMEHGECCGGKCMHQEQHHGDKIPSDKLEAPSGETKNK